MTESNLAQKYKSVLYQVCFMSKCAISLMLHKYGGDVTGVGRGWGAGGGRGPGESLRRTYYIQIYIIQQQN